MWGQDSKNKTGGVLVVLCLWCCWFLIVFFWEAFVSGA